MKYILYKMSSPGWEEEFESEFEARRCLLGHICGGCLEGSRTYVGENGELITDEDGDEPPDRNNTHELLSTACGCEFGYEEVA